MNYTVSIRDLVRRPLGRVDLAEEWMNKMTDEEIKQWEKELTEEMIDDGHKQKFPDWNASFLARTIDRGIIYTLLKEDYEKFISGATSSFNWDTPGTDPRDSK